jgi:osmoprotectant transport system permease protein
MHISSNDRVSALIEERACIEHRQLKHINRLGLLAWLFVLCCMAGQVLAAEPLRVGSKRFTESYVLGEILLSAASAAGPAEHRQGMGNTGILVSALRAGAIDVYPEYSGTIAREILKLEGNPSLSELNLALAPLGLGASVPLGFNNSYAVGVSATLAERRGLRAISDLREQNGLRFGLSHEFLGRKDGWPGLATAYGLSGVVPTGLDHGVAYEALAAERVDVIDLYATDAKILRYGIRVLRDDRQYFPAYEALLLHRAQVPASHPAQWRVLSALEGRINGDLMIRMNAAVELEGRGFREAATLLNVAGAGAAAMPGTTKGTEGEAAKEQGERVARNTTTERDFWAALLGPDLWRLTREHLVLVFGSLIASIVLGVPLGIAAARWPSLAQPIFAVVGVIQTIPSLALLAFLIALMGTIGAGPAAVALVLYALLPIVRNTHTGMQAVGAGLSQAALALGLSARDRLRYVELPLAAPAIIAGVKTSAVINVGTATIAAFIGAGGYGERIASGLALNDNVALLAGAVPAAILALLIQAGFELLERSLLRWPRHGRA